MNLLKYLWPANFVYKFPIFDTSFIIFSKRLACFRLDDFCIYLVSCSFLDYSFFIKMKVDQTCNTMIYNVTYFGKINFSPYRAC